MDCSTPGFPVHHWLLDFAPTHVHQVGDAIQPSHPLSSPSPPPFSLSQHQFSSGQSLTRVRLFVIAWITACQASLSITSSRSSLKLTSIESSVFSNELVLCIRWSKYWSFSSSISPSKEHPGVTSFRMDWFDLLYSHKKGSALELLFAKFRLKLRKVGKTTRPFSYDLHQSPYDYKVEVDE